MADLFWYGVTIRFLCPACERTSTEQLVLSLNKPNPAAINDTVTHYRLFCQLCKTLLKDGSQVDFHVEPGTPERLKSLGFVLPSETDR